MKKGAGISGALFVSSFVMARFMRAIQFFDTKLDRPDEPGDDDND